MLPLAESGSASPGDGRVHDAEVVAVRGKSVPSLEASGGVLRRSAYLDRFAGREVLIY